MKNNFPITPNQPDVKSVMQNNGLWFMNENLEKGMTCGEIFHAGYFIR